MVTRSETRAASCAERLSKHLLTLAAMGLLLAGCAPAPAATSSAASPAPAPSRLESGATCDGERRCPAHAPYCVVGAGNRRCATQSEIATLKHDGRSAALRCTRPRDCATGEHCCTTPLADGTHCAASCDGANNLTVCRQASDCPNSAANLCEPPSPDDAPSLPAWLLVCAAS